MGLLRLDCVMFGVAYRQATKLRRGGRSAATIRGAKILYQKNWLTFSTEFDNGLKSIDFTRSKQLTVDIFSKQTAYNIYSRYNRQIRGSRYVYNSTKLNFSLLVSIVGFRLLFI